MERHIPYLYRGASQSRYIQASLREIRRPGDKLGRTTRHRWWTRELHIFNFSCCRSETKHALSLRMQRFQFVS